MKLFTAVLALAGLLTANACVAQAAWPHKPIHLLVGFPSGSQPDIVARLLGQALGETLRESVLVENVTGAAGRIAAERVSRAPGDGYTLALLSQTQIVINPTLYRRPYEAARDFAPVTQVTVSPNILVVSNAVAARSVPELVSLARAHPGELTFASSGAGTGTHMAAELFMAAAGIDLRHIPYKGVVAAIPDLVAGRVSMMFSPLPVVLPLVREGKLRALAVTSLHRSSAAAELPTVAESGYPVFEATNWYGLVAPAGTPSAIVHRLHIDTAKALQSPDVRGKLAGLGIDAIGNSPEEFAAVIRTEIPLWAKVIRDAGVTPDR
jgi:tripartite-type tricarboxylate transporter receptor subunit TctC